MMRRLLAEGEALFGSDWVASWDAVERAAAQIPKGRTRSVLADARTEAMTWVAELRHAAESKAAYGATEVVRKQFVVGKLAQGSFSRLKRKAPEAGNLYQDELMEAEILLAEPVARMMRPAVQPEAENEPVWYSTTRMTLAHRRAPGGEWLPACSQRQGKERIKAADPDQILWSGDRHYAKKQGRRCCPNPMCSWS